MKENKEYTVAMDMVPATRGQTGLAVAAASGSFGIEGLEGIEQSDLIIPRWNLIQPTSQREGADEHIGQFARNIDNVFKAELETVVLSVTRTRILWSGDRTETRPECVSRDGLIGTRYGACAACDFNPQVHPDLREAAAKGLSKICNFGYQFLLVDDVKDGSLAFLGAMGTSVRAAKALITQFVATNRPPFAALVKWETEKQANEKGKYYVLQPSIVRWLDDAEMATYRGRWQSLQGATIREVDDVEGDGEGEATPAPF